MRKRNLAGRRTSPKQISSKTLDERKMTADCGRRMKNDYKPEIAQNPQRHGALPGFVRLSDAMIYRLRGNRTACKMLHHATFIVRVIDSPALPQCKNIRYIKFSNCVCDVCFVWNFIRL